MAAKYKNLDIAISADTSKLEKGVRTATRSVEGLDKQIDTARRGAGKFDDQLRRGTGGKAFGKGVDQAGRATTRFDGSLRKTQEELKRTEATAEKSGRGFGTRLTAGVRGSVGKLGVSLRENLSGKSVLSAAKTGGALAAGAMGLSMLMNLGDALKEGIGDVFAAVGEQAANKANLVEKLGLNQAQAARAGKATGQAYANNFGDSLTTVNDAVRSVIQNIDGMRGASQKTLQYMAQRSITTADVMDADVGEVTRTISQMLRTGMAKNAKEAFDILTRGAQRGGNAAGDLLDTFNEYSTQFRDLGLSGRDAMGLLQQGMKGGARDSDLVADALKELNIRVKSLDTNAVPALKALGLNANQMAEAFSQGGPKARAALGQILTRLSQVKDPAKRAQLAMKLFGTQSEDMAGALGKLDLSKARKQLGDVAGATDKAGNAFSNTAAGKIESWKRKIKMAVVDFIGDKVIPALERLDRKAGVSKGISAFLKGFQGKDTSKLSGDLKKIADAGASVRNAFERLGRWWDKTGAPVFRRAWKIFRQDLKPSIDDLQTSLNQPGFRAFQKIMGQIANVLFKLVVPAFAKMVAFNFSTFLWVLARAADLAGFMATGFRNLAVATITAFQNIIHGAAKAFGWMPGIGPKLRAADRSFTAWGNNAIRWLNNAGNAATRFGRKHQIALQQARAAQARYKTALAVASAEIRKNGRQLDSNTAAGRRQRTAVAQVVNADRQYITKLKQSGASNEQVRRAIIRHRDKLRDLTGDTKYGRKIQGYYNNELKKIPPRKRTNITVHGNGSFTIPKDVSGAIGSAFNLLKGLKFAGGGAVTGPGTGTSDSIPARLSTGEHVIPAREVEAAGGQQAIYALRGQIRAGGRMPGFARGGAVGPAGLYRSNTPALGTGTARGYGNTSAAVIAATAATLGKAWKKEVEKVLFSAAPGVGGGVTRWRPIILRVLAMLGMPAALVGGVETLINRESGGNPRAINLWDSNARAGHPSQGLMQTIPGTFNAYAGPFRRLGITNPLANIYAGLNYIKHRYPSLGPIRPGWSGGYDSGGLAVGAGLLPKATVKPERVLSPRQTEAFERLVARLPVTRIGTAAATAPGQGAQPYIGSLTVQTTERASADQIIDAAFYEVRVAARGGVHAR